MRVPCNLRTIRGQRKLRDLEQATGIARGTLSRIERGNQFATDKQVEAIEQAYNAPVETWYPRRVLIAINLLDDEGRTIAA